MNVKRLILTGLLAVFIQAPLGANPFNIPENLDQSIRQGLNELYNLNFKKAEEIFDSISDQAAEHPMVAFGKASVHWWRLSVDVLENDPEESAPFLKAAEECIRLSKEKIERGDPTGEGHLTLGGASGLLGRWQATNQKWVPAYFTGKKAVKFLRKALKVNPRMVDANMGLGIFDYYVATLPRMVRVLAFIGSQGDSRIGLAELEMAAQEGIYSTTPSKLFLVEIYANPENNPERTRQILGELRADFPKSSFIHMLDVITRYNFEQVEELAVEAASFHKKIEDKIYPPERAPDAHFASALVPFKQRQWAESLPHFDRAIASGTAKNPWTTWATLYKGYALDALDRRAEATLQYKAVLKQMRRWGSHDAAKRRLSRPFKGTDEDMDKLVL